MIFSIGSIDLKIMDEKNDAVDRISELPPFIIHEIMCYLSTKEVAQTSVLSKRWNQLRISFPYLDFDQNCFVEKSVCHINFHWRRQTKSFCVNLKRFIEFIDASVHQFCKFNLCMEYLRLYVSLLNVKRSTSKVNKWIAMAVASDVKYLDFEVLSDEDTPYTLPPIIFSAKLLTTLRLSGCKLEHPSDTIRFHSLTKLRLDRVCLSGEIVQKLISECPLLEDLLISKCWGFKYLGISKTRKLKIMKIYPLPELELLTIVAPSLQDFALEDYGKCGPLMIDMAGCPNLSKLSLKGTTLRNQEFNHLISKFPFLEDLSVDRCDTLKTITISSDQLKNLSLKFCSNLKAIDVNSPNLHSFFYEDWSVPSFPVTALCPWEVSFYSKPVIDTRWYLSIKEFLGISYKVEDLSICVGSVDKNSFDLDEFRMSLPSLPLEVEKLSLHVNTASPNYAALLDGLLAICFPKTLSVDVTWWSRFFEWLYDQLQNRDVNCCSSRDFKCWRHYLKDIKIESFLKTDVQELLDVDELMDTWPNLPNGILQFRVDWCFPLCEKA